MLFTIREQAQHWLLIMLMQNYTSKFGSAQKEKITFPPPCISCSNLPGSMSFFLGFYQSSGEWISIKFQIFLKTNRFCIFITYLVTSSSLPTQIATGFSSCRFFISYSLLTALVDCASAATPYMVSVGRAITFPPFRDATATFRMLCCVESLSNNILRNKVKQEIKWCWWNTKLWKKGEEKAWILSPSIQIQILQTDLHKFP